MTPEKAVETLQELRKGKDHLDEGDVISHILTIFSDFELEKQEFKSELKKKICEDISLYLK